MEIKPVPAIDRVMPDWCFDIGRHVGITQSQSFQTSLRDHITDPSRFQPLLKRHKEALLVAQFKPTELTVPAELSGRPSRLWSLTLVRAGRKSFKKL